MAKGRVTVIDIARAAGVSKSTVSLVLQGSPLVNEATRAKVTVVMRELGYVYNRGAATLRQTSGNTKIIGMVVNDLTNGFFAELAVGVDTVVQSAGFVQFLANTAERVDRQQEVIASMREHGISGLIISPARETTALDLKAVTEAGIPVVTAVRNIPGAKCSSLVSDNAAGTLAGVKHLAGLGHKRIAFLGGYPDIMVFQERYRGYCEGLQAVGHELHADYVIASSASRAGGVDAIGRALKLPEPPTAAVCFNDAVAFGVCDGLRVQGLEAGPKFGVVGFDDVIEAKTAVPSLTTVSVDPQGMGQKAAQLLLKQINAGKVEAESVTTAVRLIVRESCGATVRGSAEAPL
ncbi:substrate-binding domain-containing protein [Rhizobium sp. CG5]|uniref:LacI family DNA-binding transcriptional regulator n=1 Tax=Rhizobium sp. CG5 TaxID=2726076 RepID=UPI0020343D5F|nr:LacI family DNA-binding transcriptional regulator [Rhizobium sp. CG5]MCM2475500.1 substrate-binding domain-containing protein [Rhizobium sp. CG5]